jgi:hypothetical protein
MSDSTAIPGVIINFAGDPETYDVQATIGAVVTYWIRDRLTDAEMMELLRQFQDMYDHGVPDVLFMRDIFAEDSWLETSVWFMEYGVKMPDDFVNSN